MYIYHCTAQTLPTPNMQYIVVIMMSSGKEGYQWVSMVGINNSVHLRTCAYVHDCDCGMYCMNIACDADLAMN